MKFISRFETPVNHKSIVKNSKPESRNMEFTHLEKKNIMSNLSEGRGGGGGTADDFSLVLHLSWDEIN